MPGKSKKSEAIAVNRKARHEYLIEETFEAGVVLTGPEVKSARNRRVSLQEAFARIDGTEAWIYNVHIAPYEHGNRYNVDPTRKRKLLLHRGEIDQLRGKTEAKGMTIVPLRFYFRNGYAKIELGVGRGKKLYDKRETAAKRDAQREVERALHSRSQ